MSENVINRHLHRARTRLEGIPKRAIEGGWETDDALSCEIQLVIAHALIAQAEISQETLRKMDEISHRIGSIDLKTVRHEAKVPYDAIYYYAKDVVNKMAAEHKKEQTGFFEELFRKLFGGEK